MYTKCNRSNRLKGYLYQTDATLQASDKWVVNIIHHETSNKYGCPRVIIQQQIIYKYRYPVVITAVSSTQDQNNIT